MAEIIAGSVVEDMLRRAGLEVSPTDVTVLGRAMSKIEADAARVRAALSDSAADGDLGRPDHQV